MVRVLSAELAAPTEGAAPQPQLALRPKSIDDLFSPEADFRVPAPWAVTDDGEDPLALHELTSVFVLSETAGFALAFHCLQAVDPCAV
mmetsp:Transcript_11616/g.27300  ORF Transcript_11616/g.27300 Transcript_11616/m.27300 type:complete len:88 (+) Transcript_11616:315-578(+)